MAEEAKDKKEGNDGGGKEGAANVKTCALLLNNSASRPVVVNCDKKEKDGKERSQLHHTRIGLHGCSQTPCPGKRGKTLHIDHNNGSPLMRFNH